MDPLFVHLSLSQTETQSDVIRWLNKFGKVSNFDDAKTLSTSGCIVYGDVRKIYPPVLLKNGMFNCVFMMEQVTHLRAPHEGFRILLRLKSPEPLSNLEVGSFLAVFNPRPFSVAQMKCFSSGPEGVIVWYSKARVPISRPEVVNKLTGPVSIASSLNVLPIKNSFNTSRPQPVDFTSVSRSGASDDRFNMPPPSNWIDMRRNQGSIGPTKDLCSTSRDCCTSETSGCSKKSHAHSSMHHKSKCSHHSEHHSHHPQLCCSAFRTDQHCCSHYEHQRSCSATCKPHVSCCSHREPPTCHSSLRHTCGCSRSCAVHQWAPSSCGGSCHHHSNPSKSSECCARSICRNKSKDKNHDVWPNKTCSHENSSSNQEGNGWFIKKWVEQSKPRIGEEKTHIPSGSQDIDSQLLTGRATYGGSVVDEVSSDDDNFTSISQVIPTLQSSQGLKCTATSDDDDSDSSLSDTSTLFLKPKNTSKFKPLVRADPIVKQKGIGLPASSIVEVVEASPTVSEDVTTDSQIKTNPVTVQTTQIKSNGPSKFTIRTPQAIDEGNNKSSRIEPMRDACDDLNSSTEMAEESQNTCPQLLSVQSILPIKRPGCEASSEEYSTPTKKKRKLFDPSDSSWYFDSGRQDPVVLSPSKRSSSKHSPAKPAEAMESSAVQEVVKDSVDIEVINQEQDEKQKERVVESASQESVGIIPPSDVECELRNLHKKLSCSTPMVSGLPRDRLLEGIIEEWASDSNSSNSAVPVLKTAHDILKDLTNGDDQGAKETAVPGPAVLIENNPSVSQAAGEHLVDLVNHRSLNDVSRSDGTPLSKGPPPAVCVSVEHEQNFSRSLTKAPLSTRLSPESPIFANETVFFGEMSQTLCEPSEEPSNVADANPTAPADSMSQNPAGDSKKPVPCERSELCHQFPSVAEPDFKDSNRIFETQNSSEEVGPITFDVPVTVHSPDRNGSNRMFETQNSSEEVRPITFDVPVTVHAPDRNGSNQMFETQNSSEEVRPITFDVPVTVHAPDCNDSNRIFETRNSSEEVRPITFDVPVTVHAMKVNSEAEVSQTLCEVQEYPSNVSNAPSSQIILTHDETLPDVDVNIPAAASEKPNPSSPSEQRESHSDKTPNVAEVISTNRISETENSSAPIESETPAMVIGTPNSLKEDLRRRSPDSTTDGQSEELKQEYPMRNSPASTVFYDAEGENHPSEENHLEVSSLGQDIEEKITASDQIFEVQGVIVDLAPHINRETVSSIVLGVCSRGCKSRFSYNSFLQLPIITRSCVTCACQSHRRCPVCHESGLKKTLCLEFAFELHVLIGDKVLRLQVESQEAVKFLGIRPREILRKSRRAVEMIKKLESLCCRDPEEKTCRLTGLVRVATELRLGKIVPLLVGTRLKDFKMSEVPL